MQVPSVGELHSRRRWLLAVISLLAYLPLFLAVHAYLGNVALALVFLPSLVWAISLGPWAGLSISLILSGPNYLILLRLQAVMTAREQFVELITTHVVIAAVSYIVGDAFRVRQKLARELGERKASETRYRALFDHTNDGIFLIGLDKVIQTANQKAGEMLGYAVEELVGRNLDDLVAQEEHTNLDARLAQLLEGETLPIYERTFIRKSGRRIRAEVNVALIYDAYGQPHYVQSICRDITDRKVAEETLFFKATHDELTGLHNRSSFFAFLTRAVERARRNNFRLAILFLDLDGFKKVNDTLGHAAGDVLLKQSGDRLGEHVRAGEVLARVGGDEFAILLDPISSRSGAEFLAKRIEQELSKPFTISGKKATVSASVGIALFPDDANDPESLLKFADRAMYEVKQQHHATASGLPDYSKIS